MKPILKYRGGKSKEIPYFLPYFPAKFDTYYEPFVGGGAVFFHIEPQKAVINDINPKLISFYKGMADDFQKVENDCLKVFNVYSKNRKEYVELKSKNPGERVPDKNEKLYYDIRDMYNGLVPNAYSEAFVYYFINKTAYSGMVRYNSSGQFNVPYGRYPSFSTDGISQRHSELLKRAEICNADYSDIFEQMCPEDFAFLDPPYDCVFSDYGNSDDFTEKSQRRLAQDFRNVSSRCLMIIGSTPLTKELYQGFIRDEYGKNYAVNIRNRFHSAANHLIITNY